MSAQATARKLLDRLDPDRKIITRLHDRPPSEEASVGEPPRQLTLHVKQALLPSGHFFGTGPSTVSHGRTQTLRHAQLVTFTARRARISLAH